VANHVGDDLIQQNLLGDAIDQAPVAVFVAGEDQRYLAVNAYACELLGYTREELLGLSVTDVAVDADAAASYEELVRSGVGAGSTTLRRKDGTELAMSFRASVTTVGGIAVFVGVCWPAA
jgi:PAS domain S-box-containing protein